MPAAAARDLDSYEVTQADGVSGILRGLGYARLGQEIPAAAARDLDSDEVTQADDVSGILRGLGYARLGQEIRCRKMKKLPPE